MAKEKTKAKKCITCGKDIQPVQLAGGRKKVIGWGCDCGVFNDADQTKKIFDYNA